MDRKNPHHQAHMNAGEFSQRERNKQYQKHEFIQKKRGLGILLLGIISCICMRRPVGHSIFTIIYDLQKVSQQHTSRDRVMKMPLLLSCPHIMPHDTKHQLYSTTLLTLASMILVSNKHSNWCPKCSSISRYALSGKVLRSATHASGY